MSSVKILASEECRNANKRPPPPTLWVYLYEIGLRPGQGGLRTIQTLLDTEESGARRGARTWGVGLVVAQQGTRILVVTDTPDQHREVNRRLEATLDGLGAGFSMTMPMAVVGVAARHLAAE